MSTDAVETTAAVKHPATWSRADLELLDRVVPPGLYLDPCAGVGKIHRLERDDRTFVGVEIEKPWADVDPRTIHGDMFEVVKDWADHATRFDGIVTSWVFGNRMSDSHNAQDASRRHSYTHDIRTMTGDNEYTLDENNAGTMYFWNDNYRDWHRRAYRLLHRVVNDSDKSSFFNVKNFYRTPKKGGAQIVERVVGWHMKTLLENGWRIVTVHEVGVPGLRHGENHEARADAEAIIEARKG